MAVLFTEVLIRPVVEVTNYVSVSRFCVKFSRPQAMLDDEALAITILGGQPLTGNVDD